MIDLQVMSEEQISELNLELGQLWMVRLHGQFFGPYEFEALKSYAAQHEDLFADADVMTMAEEENWVMFLQSPLRTAKKKAPPQLISAATLQIHNSYHIERHGQRQGPHTREKILELIAKGELLPTDLISEDEGFTWQKLYHLKSFESRPHQSDLLPAAPPEDSFARAHAEALKALMTEENPVKEGLVSLAHYGHRKTTSAPLNLDELTALKVSAPLFTPPPRSWVMGGGAATAMLAVLIWWAQSPAPQEVAQTSVVQETVEAGESLLNPVQQRLNRRPASTMPARIIPPTSMKSGSYGSTRQGLMEYRDTHDTDREIPEPAEPMDVDPYGADSQVAGNDPAAAAGARNPAAGGDDGYRMEEPVVPGETGPVVEEVGDF